MWYYLGRALLYIIFKIFFRLRVFGRKDFPKKGAVIVAVNHTSFLDPMVAGVSAPRVLYFLAREDLFKRKIWRGLLYLVNVFPIRREKTDVRAVKFALDKLSNNKALLIFPEGTRSKDGELQKIKYGIGFLAYRSNASMVPCYIKGTGKAWPRNSRSPRLNPISVHFGKPLKVDREAIDKKDKDVYKEISDKVMMEISKLKDRVDKCGDRD